MPFTVTIRKNDNSRRGNVSRTVEFENECRVSDMIGAIDGLLRQCFPDDMRHRGLNLSRDTTTGNARNEVSETTPPTRVNDTMMWIDEVSPSGVASGSSYSGVDWSGEASDRLPATPPLRTVRYARPTGRLNVDPFPASDVPTPRPNLIHYGGAQERAYMNGFTELPTTNTTTEGN